MLRIGRARAVVLWGLVAADLIARPVSAQQSVQTSPQEQTSDSVVVVNQKHYIRRGNVEVHVEGQNGPNGKTDIYADMIEFFEDEERAVGTGNVVVAQGANRITAERADFNTKTWLGTFYNASGIATMPQPKPQVRPGTVTPPPVPGQDTVVYFFGETVEKVAPKKYKITKGGFSTCVQPTPRWDMSATTVFLNLDHYTVLTNAVMTVKGVPMLYLPVLYYPTKKDGRATGFLIPVYGSSTLKGQQLSNQFYWVLSRSEDLSFSHDWYSKVGQGVGSEFRYNYGATSNGDIRGYFLDQHDTTYVLDDGTTQDYPANHSYEIHGNANELLPGGFRARGRVDYFSSILTSQTFNTNVTDLTRNQRSYGGNIVGAWSSYSLNATLDHSEYFYDPVNSVLSGSWPRVALNRNERPLFGSDFYFTLGTEYAHLLSQKPGTDPTTGADNGTVVDQSLNRFDFWPQIRYPFKKWGWLTANSTISWRDTFYSRILSPPDPTNTVPQVITDESYNRKFFNFQTQITGPVFNRIWDTPDNGYAEKFKHTIEPSLLIQKTTDVPLDPTRLVFFDGTDSFVGGTQLTYALTNRFYAKQKLAPGQPAQAREIISVDIRQSYYTNQTAAQFDPTYQSTLIGGGTPSNYSPIALNIRVTPTTGFTGTVTMDFDSHYHALRDVTVGGTYNWLQQVQATLTWSKKGYIPELAGFNDPTTLDHYINGSTTLHTRDNKFGGTFSANYDVLRRTLLQESVTGFYNAQCCGLAMQYQVYNNPYVGQGALPSDHRFFISFTLAGLGNFSPFNSALSGAPH